MDYYSSEGEKKQLLPERLFMRDESVKLHALPTIDSNSLLHRLIKRGETHRHPSRATTPPRARTSHRPYYATKRLAMLAHSRPRCINRRHRFRIPEGGGGWADEQSWHIAAWDGPCLSP